MGSSHENEVIETDFLAITIIIYFLNITHNISSNMYTYLICMVLCSYHIHYKLCGPFYHPGLANTYLLDCQNYLTM